VVENAGRKQILYEFMNQGAFPANQVDRAKQVVSITGTQIGPSEGEINTWGVLFIKKKQ